jgi:hypothetical protein
MTVDQIRKLHYKQEGREEAIKQLILKQYSKGLSNRICCRNKY